MLQVLKAGILYFALVFSAGFALGPLRILYAVPRFGTRVAELIETPIMLVVIFLAARWIIRRFALPSGSPTRLGMGFLALKLLITAEFAVVLWLGDMSIREYISNRDPVSGTIYYISLTLFALMPLLVSRKRTS